MHLGPAAWLSRRRLDRELASGLGSWRSPRHSAPSLQITSSRGRRALARSLDELLVPAGASRRATAIRPAVAVDHRAVEGARWRLECLAERLYDDAPVSAAGIAALRDLLSDTAGPVYNPLCGYGLGPALASIQAALEVVD